MRIAILMSTYNGEKYVGEQIESILHQKLPIGTELQLFIRDDGSKDSTTDILCSYAANYKNITFINETNAQNVGIQRSFLFLLEYANIMVNADFYAFADQDDVWLEGKIGRGLEIINKVPEDCKGRLYYSNKTFVDENLNFISDENIVFYHDIFEVFFKSLAFGCTMIFDRILAEICLLHKPKTEILHDSWVYHIAKLIGSKVFFDSTSYILYRQHGDNNIGIEGASLYNSNIFFMLKRVIPVLFIKRKHSKQKYVEEVYNNYKNLIPVENKIIVEDIIRYNYSIAAKLRLIVNRDINKRDFKTRLVWSYDILFNII